MKKVLAILCLTAVLLLTSCVSVKKEGLESFSSGQSPVDLTHMVPPFFMDTYQYTGGNHFYYQPANDGIERFILWLCYDEENYTSARAEALEYNRVDPEAVPEITIDKHDFYLSGLEESFEASLTNRSIYMYVVLNETDRVICFMYVTTHYSNDTINQKIIDGIYAERGLKGLIDEYFIEWYDFYETDSEIPNKKSPLEVFTLRGIFYLSN